MIYTKGSTFRKVSEHQKCKILLSICFHLQARLFYLMHGEFLQIYDISRVVSTSLRAVSQDETIYSNPDTFNPDRFFNPDGTLNDDKIEYAFGYGRRDVPFIAWCIPVAH